MQSSKMLLLSTPITTFPPHLRRPGNFYGYQCRRIGQSMPLRVQSMAKDEADSGNGIVEKAAIAAGLISTPVIGWSLYTLKTTGCGLPPGPGGSIGALEGVSYLAVVGIVGWSAYTKAKTGSGLPNGPFGLLGAVEGLSYLSLVAIVVVFGLQFAQQGSLPGPLPSDQCFG
ncbi:OLC1v1010824C1 [Oldenlandia corymbosa var. corymbosa]|uniref:OLC1v1010824C1 n=1 Tax=Oldenlandia corymbosa var. corymbosa TaxID=529605 RepID=A0AAV1DVF2_OLDCO|nr:OLC1v1010824C1 [Oldenlandia corymbosa var. corymbosa]